ncbi:MAG TPA: TonB-dependent receptor [Steroidobacteraceae bacterium]|jgi:iron complex outermembrane receptor protein|nr:TonB-dependent receptor [Steroidobacteraceae bacterium]
MNTNSRVDFLSRSTRVLLFVLALAVATGIRPSMAAADLGQQMQFDIAPQQLSSALLKFSAQSDIQVTVPGQLVEGKNSPGVVGKYKAGSALAILLKDTALRYDVVDGSTVVITGPADRKTAVRNDSQKISDPVLASAMAPSGQEIKLAQATSTTTQTPSGQIPSAVTTSPAGPSASSDNLSEIVVTGTSIKGLDAESALPVTVLKAEDIARTGATSAEDLFRYISSASSSGSTVQAQATGNQTGSISTISLRGLTSARTLVLINGLRSAPYGGGSTGTAGNSVDISSIPVAAIERVEILKDGASAIYGSDAIAGVVNFILKDNFQGVDASVYGGAPTRSGGGTEQQANFFGGIGDLKTDRYNVNFGLEFDHVGEILGASRPFATRYSPQFGNDVTSSFAFPANIAVFPAPAKGKPTTINPDVGACAPSLSDVNFPSQCRFDNSPYDSVQPDTKRGNALLNAHYQISDTTQLYTQLNFAHVETTTQVQPVPLSYQNPLLPGNPFLAYQATLLATQYPTYHNPAITPTAAAFLLPPSSQYYPTAFAAANGLAGLPLNLIYRDFANGPRLEEDTSDTTRAVAGWKGNLAGWDFDTSVLYSEVKVKEDLKSGFPLYSKIMPILDSGIINPFGPTTDPAALAMAQGADFEGQDWSSQTSLTSLSGHASRALLDLPGGPLSAAVGAEVRRETFIYDPSGPIQTGDITGEGGNQLPENAARSVESAYLEVNMPIVHSLDADAAVRYDHYQAVGSTVNPKGSLKFQPFDWWLLRASAGSGFRAPSLTDLYAAQATSVTANGTRDPIKCPTFDPNNPACSFQFSTVTGGNPNLKPEKSTTLTWGTVFTPVQNLSLGLDTFWIYLKNAIVVGGLPVSTILQNAASATQFASLIQRDANGNIVFISQTNANLFREDVTGTDVDFKYAFDISDYGRITVLLDGTYYYKFDTQNPDGSWTGQIDKGLTTVSGVISRWRHSASLVYDIGPWDASITQRYQKKYHDSAATVTGANREVGQYDTFDGQLSYHVNKAWTFTLGVINIADTAPPYANYASSANNFVGGYDLSYGDPRGRFVYGRVGFQFR